MLACAALDEARRSGKLALYAYVIMTDHVHVVTDSALSPAKTLRFINGISAHRIIEYLRANDFESSLKRLQHVESRRRHKYSVWDHHTDVRLPLAEAMVMQRVT
jgi:REP element-mobilizing transposase RayT